MRLILLSFLLITLLPAILCYNDEYSNEELMNFLLFNKRDLGSKNPLKFIGKCLSDSECKKNEYCDHHGINPFGSCKAGKDNNQTCVMDRYCKSKVCHHLKCMARKPVKDGPCSKDQHQECIPEQYCHHVKKEEYICSNRKCSGLCGKDVHCLSNKCSLFHCKKPNTGC